MRNVLRTHLIAGTVLLAMGFAATASAQTQNAYSVSGTWKSIRGIGTVNIPTFGSFPQGGLPTASLIQTTDGVNSAPPMIIPGHFFNFPQATMTTGMSGVTKFGAPVFGNVGRLAGVTNPFVAQLRTNFQGVGPVTAMPVAASGRSGPATITYCPGGT